MDLIGALVHFTSFDAKFQFGNEEETRKDCYYSLGKFATGHTAVLAGDNFFLKKKFYNVTEHFAGGL